MMPSLLHTKIQLPPLRTQHIYRERLTAHIEANPEARVVLVSAPAGFGKSSYLAEWGHKLRHTGAVVAWYTLDERDNDPVRFATYLVGAFQAANAGFRSFFEDGEQVMLQDAVEHILNAVAQIDTPVVLMLDDYHLIGEPAIHEVVGVIADYLPVNMRLAIGTRADPPLHLSRLRARRVITEVRMADLRFNTVEISRWLQLVLGWTPSEPVIAQVDALTEGWAAALALMMSQPQMTKQAFESQITHSLLSHRHIFDYFAQEVFEQQPDTLQAFLLDTCVLNWMHPALCHAMTESVDAPDLLNQLAAKSLFVIPLSDTEPIYRYHHLFEQFLRQRFETQNREGYLAKHRHAADWHISQDNIIEAMHHALASEDADFAAQLIETRAWAALTSRGEIVTILNWIPYFDFYVLKHHPRMCLYFSRALYLTGDIERSRRYVQIATETLDDGMNEGLERQSFQAIAYNYQATLAAYRGDIQAGLRWIGQANALHEKVDPLDQVRIANTDAFLRYLIGDVATARRAYTFALELAQQIHHDYLTLDAHYYLAQIDLMAGELEAVQARCESVMAQYTTRIGPLSLLMVPLAAVRYQQNRVEAAEAMLRDAIELARRANIPDILWLAYASLADVLMLRGAVEEAGFCITRAQEITQDYRSPIMVSFVSATQARLLLRSHQMQLAGDWAVQYQQVGQVDYQRDYENITLAQVWLTQGKYAETLKLLADVIADAQTAGRIGTIITAETLKALSYQFAGMGDEALAALERALILARPRGFVRVFLDLGLPIVKLLRRAVEHGVAADYAAYLLDVALQADTVRHPADTLTEREIEVLTHIANGASNQEIAAALVISLGTVKSHIHHIMNKLDARNRTEAVRKARSLNIFKN